MNLSLSATQITILSTILEFSNSLIVVSITVNASNLKYCFGMSFSNREPIPAAGTITGIVFLVIFNIF